MQWKSTVGQPTHLIVPDEDDPGLFQSFLANHSLLNIFQFITKLIFLFIYLRIVSTEYVYFFNIEFIIIIIIIVTNKYYSTTKQLV